jgi:hypothetical protein
MSRASAEMDACRRTIVGIPAVPAGLRGILVPGAGPASCEGPVS